MEAAARTFITQYYDELNRPEEEKRQRLEEVLAQIRATGTYTHTYDELVFGAKVAWRNSNRCIGRLFWERLHVHDARHLNRMEDVVQGLYDHIAYATNGGKVIPTITVFQQGSRMRIWNHQLVRYAGYERNGQVIGDPASLALTRICEQLGWRGAGTPFDVLPLVVSIDDSKPQWFPIPAEIVQEVSITHPTLPAFATLNLQWYAVPIISDMRLEIGGISYFAAPFNGWYMGTEIGARNLADDFRYNCLPHIAHLLGLNMAHESTLWRDEALVELNRAVLYSYQKAGVSIVDHHTAAKQFEQFCKREHRQSREVTGDWTWLIPPLSPAQTDIFHQEYRNEVKTPNFFYEQAPYG
ncbi:nitric oxide synthase oxygenase [Shouchella lonarensis]|uniref:Nitric oxide synthase oxygenase n=1 Tax=Shouchella lonarensis TaxID=1464122 RepID=A0A1G6H330_9BACI|nr:nitric oxide synthase oxygenase [Shouchella lonarensis]SDB88720.1 nitric-oxide synthase [Shouchella lonarensis]